MMKHILIVLFAFVCLPLMSAEVDSVDVCLFHNKNITSVVFTPVNSTYLVSANGDKEYKLEENKLLYISCFNNQILVSTLSNVVGVFDTIRICSTDSSGYFRLKPIKPSLESRSYDDNIVVTNNSGSLKLINRVDVNKYLAGVVLAEAGPNIIQEFYKTQALISRTYLLGHIDRHLSEGFNVCDDVHCQAYHGRNNINHKIFESVVSTDHLIIVDSVNDIITAAFHSNSGGLTSNSEVEWSSPLPYLRSVVDPYSINQRNYKWTKKVSIDEWRNFLKENDFSSKSIRRKKLMLSVKNRNKFLIIGEDSIRTREIRKYFNLRSSFFSIDVDGRYVVFNGLGYGHGVGLSQIGAMKMALLGFNYEQIIKFYYNNVQLVSYDKYLEDKRNRETATIIE